MADEQLTRSSEIHQEKEGNALHPIMYKGVFDLSSDIIRIWDIIRFHQMRVVHFASIGC